MIDTDDAGDEGRPSKIRITVVIQNRYAIDDGVMTGTQIKEMANIPAGFSLHRRAKGEKESIDDDQVMDVHNGDHFFAQPPGQPGRGHSEELERLRGADTLPPSATGRHQMTNRARSRDTEVRRCVAPGWRWT